MDQNSIKTDLESENTAVRFIQQLKIRIGDAKNLQPKNGSSSLKDCFCVIRLDREEIFRTHCANEKTLHPFFGEEFYFDIPRIFRFLSIYLYQRERTVNTIRNRPLGKVTIRRNHLCKFNSEEAWFPLLPINHESEIQGKINFLVESQYILKLNSLRILVCVLQCQDLCESCCDSHAVINLKFNNNMFVEKTKVKKKTANPQYNESFYFEIPLERYGYNDSELQHAINDLFDNSELRIVVWNNSTSKSISGFLGEVKTSFNLFELNKAHKAWYYLQPNSIQLNAPKINLGSLRLRLDYISNYVFSTHFYESFRKLLLSSTDFKPITSSVAYMLGEFVLNKADAAQPLVKIFLHYKKLVPLIRFLSEVEISKTTDVNTIFRGNSLVSKCIDELMKLVGNHYLHDIIKDFVNSIILQHKSCEIDPSKIKDNESIENNMNNLKHYTACVFNAITSSAARCPQIMRDVFAVLKELAIQYFPDNKEVCYYVTSGFVFLRFFAPSILNPRLFGLTDLNIDARNNRTFTLISKTIQSIGNLVVFKKNNQIIKESYMMPLFKDFIIEERIIKTKEFLESISSPCQLLIKGNQEPIILKESVMHKKSMSKRIGFGNNCNKRYFCITTQHFFYAKAKNKTPLFKFPIGEIVGVKKSDIYPIKNMFQVLLTKCSLYIQASNCVQEKEWIDTLNRLVQLNLNNCSKVTSYNDNTKALITPDLSIKLDPDRELERIYTLFASNLNNIQLIMEACDQNVNVVKIWKDCSKTHSSQFVIEEPRSLFENLRNLYKCIAQMEQNHQQYLTNIYGSELAPIEL